jgi:hypothetical protein
MFVTTVLALAALAQPQTPSVDPRAFDLRCLIRASQLRERTEGEMQVNAQMMAIFYFGRVDARIPEDEIEARLLREAIALEERDEGTDLTACGTFMAERGRLLSDIGEGLEAQGQ